MKQNILVHHSKFKAQTLGIAVIAVALAGLAPLPSLEAARGGGTSAAAVESVVALALAKQLAALSSILSPTTSTMPPATKSKSIRP